MSQPVNRLRSMKACRFTPTLALPVALCLLAFGSARLFAQDAAEALKLPRGLTEVVRLVGSGVGDDVVISYIQNTPVPKPTASDLIELHRAKVPSAVIVALLSKPQKPIVEAAPAAAPVPDLAVLGGKPAQPRALGACRGTLPRHGPRPPLLTPADRSPPRRRRLAGAAADVAVTGGE